MKMSKPEVIPPRLHTYVRKMNVSEDKCIRDINNKLNNYSLSDMNLVQGGIYGIKQQYNIFVGCNAQTQTQTILGGELN